MTEAIGGQLKMLDERFMDLSCRDGVVAIVAAGIVTGGIKVTGSEWLNNPFAQTMEGFMAVGSLVGLLRIHQAYNPERFATLTRLENNGINLVMEVGRTATLQVRNLVRRFR